jgi:hypothetical protein
VPATDYQEDEGAIEMQGFSGKINAHEGGTLLDKQRLLELALKGLQADKARIDQEIAEIRKHLGGRSVAMGGGEVPTPFKHRRRSMSAAARKKISEAMKRRFAAMRAAMKK